MYSQSATSKTRGRAPYPHPQLQSPRLLGQVRERLRYLHYSLRTEQNYLYWIRFFKRHTPGPIPARAGQPDADGALGVGQRAYHHVACMPITCPCASR